MAGILWCHKCAIEISRPERKPSDRRDPRIAKLKNAIISLAKAHDDTRQIFPTEGTLREGTISATRVDGVLVVSADGECADDLEKLLEAAYLATPERAAKGYSREDRVRLWRGMGNDPDLLPDDLSDADLDAMVARFTSNA